MSNFFVESEGDIELTIQHCVDLAKLDGVKYVTLAFPSHLLYGVFIKEFVKALDEDGDVPHKVDIQANIVLPSEED